MSTQAAPAARAATPVRLRHIAAAVDPFPEGEDAALLAATLGHALGNDVLLIAIEPNLGLIIPEVDLHEMREETERMLGQVRASLVPHGRTAVDTDLSAARGIIRQLKRNHRDLVVCGSSRQGRAGRVTIGDTARQLLDRSHCALALAPRGLSRAGALRLRRIGVGFDGGEESVAALDAAAEIARGAGAKLVVRGVVDDQFRAFGWFGSSARSLRAAWRDVVTDETTTLQRELDTACAEVGVAAETQVRQGAPARSLRELSEEVDLLVVGSRRWGPAAHLLLGGVGEALVRGARCSLLVVPRASTSTTD